MRKVMVPVLAAMLAAVVVPPAMAQQKQAKQQPQAQQQGPAGERLLMAPPAGWQSVPVQKTDKVAITRLYPPGQSEKQWSEMITVQIYPGAGQSPREFIENVIQFSRANCEAAGPGPVTEATINNYPAAIVSVACTKGKQSGMGNMVLVTAIKGREALYAIQRQWRGAPFAANEKPDMPPEMIQAWNNFPRSVGLCDTREPQRHPCP